jgi:two-component system, chemotaxis family, chemotaxis protein CheY
LATGSELRVPSSGSWNLEHGTQELSLEVSALSHTVLICDDAIFMRTMVSDILQGAGFEVVGEAETGIQAVEKYKQLRPDLVTMDIVMPDMGGIDAVREITKFDPKARILMCSAMGQQALVIEAIQAGARDFVVKPFQPSRVLEAVQRVLA